MPVCQFQHQRVYIGAIRGIIAVAHALSIRINRGGGSRQDEPIDRGGLRSCHAGAQSSLVAHPALEAAVTRIVLDGMGSDDHPAPEIEAALECARRWGDPIIRS